MHELSLCKAIADTATRHGAGRTIDRVSLRIGHLRQVVPRTLESSWTIVTRGSSLEGAELFVDYVPVTLTCRDCLEETVLEDPVLRCGSCNSSAIDLVSGDEFMIETIDVRPLQPLMSNDAN